MAASRHEFSTFRDELLELFNKWDSELFIILREGRHIFGIISLGVKRHGNSFTDYDHKALNNLYSYFFLFGFYLKNIANQSVIGTVDREIQMSSQIIRSIQDNVDRINVPSIDLGYIPTRKSQIFSTAADNQSAVTIHVLQGEREMASQNRTLGRFDLEGIPPAPRGVPQIEVTFDIDANGIVHVSAKDMGTGKEQSVRIESSTGLSDGEIDRMVKEAEANAESDKKERERVDVRNEADSMIYSTEKAVKDMGDKVSDADKQKINDAVAALKRALEGDNVEEIKAKTEELQKASYKIAEEIYKQQGPAGAAGAGAAGAGPDMGGAAGNAGSSASSGPSKGKADDVDYEVVDEQK